MDLICRHKCVTQLCSFRHMIIVGQCDGQGAALSDRKVHEILVGLCPIRGQLEVAGFGSAE